MKLKGYLVTTDIEKAFDSLDHTFLINALEKCGFGKTFINWINIFLNEQESLQSTLNLKKVRDKETLCQCI